MCGIFGTISNTKCDFKHLEKLIVHSQQRGKDSSGLIFLDNNDYNLVRADFEIIELVKKFKLNNSKLIFGHSRLITNGLSDNQPVTRENIAVIHNGIIVNEDEIWDSVNVERYYRIDSETILALAEDHLKNDGNLADIPNIIL